MRFNKKEKGITLVALVITIIIIIILATVTINMAFGDNGLIKQAELARDLTANSTIAEQEGMNSLLSDFANLMAENSGTTQPGGNTEIGGGTEPEEPKVPTTTEEAKPNDGEDGPEFTDTTPITDDEGNKVVIPGGFHLDEDSGTAVEDGIVIEDSNGNQFVWIPVGTYNVTEDIDNDGTKDGKLTNNLSRRQWAAENVVSEPTEVSGDNVINSSFYGEEDSRSVAYDTIEAFKTSSTTNGGFYIGRYEQGEGNICKAGVTPYTNITRDQANEQAKAMYSGNNNVTSGLISSYAWDTALNFICQTNSAGYTLATTKNSTYGNIRTGSKQNAGEYSADNYSNIHDFLGNCLEWTTEYSSRIGYPYVGRGGVYDNSSDCYAGGRYNNFNSSLSDFYLSFRIQMYIK